MKECLVAGDLNGLAHMAFGRGCGAYIKAFLSAQTAIRSTMASLVLVSASFSGSDVAGDAETPQILITDSYVHQ
ncbi:hypothetical protein CK216_09460 [Mesorhizobium sp. WSM3876]|nr:hypothetical protein CK216_09460 [Mesorhizobium sp. WSM3876]TGT59691.1 hypothetical protein EN813_029335 [Mesorhizobium sp. M00.F.Ca.ET.170.01.1.1]